MGEIVEYVPIVDNDGIVVGRALRSEVHNGSKLLHPVVHLHVLNNNGDILLQKRAETKLIQPGKWDTSVGGHITYDESIEDSLKREAYEEIGLMDFKGLKLITSYVFESDVERELINCYAIVVNDDYKPRKEESDISDLKFWSRAEISAAIGHGVLTPNFEQEYQMISSTLSEYLQNDK